MGPEEESTREGIGEGRARRGQDLGTEEKEGKGSIAEGSGRPRDRRESGGERLAEGSGQE